MKTTIASIVLLSALTAFANDADDAQEAQVRVDKVNSSAELSGMALFCEARRQSKTIACTGNIPDYDMDRIAAMIVSITNRRHTPLPGWRLTITNPGGFVATHSYQGVEH